MSYIEQIPGCFGSRDLIFAGHPLDEGRAKEMLKTAFCEESNFEIVIQKIRDFLQAQGAHEEHIGEQILKVRKMEKTYYK